MNNPESLSQLLQICTRKTEDFVRILDCKHVVWLMEIEEAAKKMFSSDFTAEPELMPKTPSQKRRRKKRTSGVPDENRDPSGRRLSRRRSSASWSSSVRRLSTRQLTKPLNESIQEEPAQPKRLTRARAQASTVCMTVSENPLEELSLNLPADRILQVKISADERRSAELQLVETLALGAANLEAVIETSALKTSAEPPTPITPEKHGCTAAKLQIAGSSTPKTAAEQVVDVIFNASGAAGEVAMELGLELSGHSTTPTGSKSDRRSVRRSIVGRKSISCRPSLANQYSLTKKRESMTKEAVRKSIRRSISKKKAMESSSSSYKSYQSSIEVLDEEISAKIGPEAAEPAVEVRSPDSPRRSLPTRGCKKIAISNLPETEEPPRMTTRQSLKSDETCQETDDQALRRKSYKRAVDELSDEHPDDDQVMSPPRKKTPSPTCPPSKVVKPPPPHMRTFLHTVQKNQLLMMTPGSISKSLVKSFIKRNTPLKTDPKEKERQRAEALRKKEEAESQRKQKIEEGKKRKQEELKLKREERLRKVLQARERVEQLEEEKKKKVEQKYAQIDEKSEKVREDRMAEEKAKKKITAKKQEDLDSRRRQEEEARKLKAKQLEEEERRQEELLQKKREEEEQERQKKLAEAKKLAEERERQRELQLAAEREQERLRAEREGERIEKEKALQLRRELERAAKEKEQQRKEAEECKRKEQQARLEQERLCKEMEAQRQRVEQQAAANAPVLNVTVDLVNSPACESYEMTPKGYKPHPPKINAEDYGMDLNSDDSTDDESRPRKPIPAWAMGSQLSQSIHHQYHRPINVNKTFGKIDSPDLELLFSKSKPRYNKRTSSAVWHSPPLSSNRQQLTVGYGLKKY